MFTVIFYNIFYLVDSCYFIYERPSIILNSFRDSLQQQFIYAPTIKRSEDDLQREFFLIRNNMNLNDFNNNNPEIGFVEKVSDSQRFNRFHNSLIDYDYKTGNYIGY
jgi:hypothetical protein